jgi:Flp pilus assembly protein TadD
MRVAWYITAAVVVLSAIVLALRQRGGDVDGEPLIPPEEVLAELFEHLELDPQGFQRGTREFVARAADLARNGESDDAKAHYALGLYLYGLRDYEGAEQAYRRAIDLEPDWSWPHNNLGIVLFRTKREDAAREAFHHAMTLDPDWYRPHNDLSILYRQTGDLERSRQEALLSIELDPDNFASHNTHGNVLVEIGDYAKAEAAYRRAIELEPNHPTPYYNCACLNSLQGNVSEAIDYLAEAIAFDVGFRDQAKIDADFDPIRDNAAFQQLVYGNLPSG